MADHDLAVGVHPLLRHRQPRGVQVDVRPAQPCHFTAAQAAQRGQPPGGVQVVLRDVGQEGRELLFGPDRRCRTFSRLLPPGGPPSGPDDRVDDEITKADRTWVSAHYQGQVLLHRVDPMHGLTTADYETLSKWLHSVPGTSSPHSAA
ncbi:hypothetical protein [Nonomuraea sp. 10N515B]|uniref:hypothetical protein n=1 Tax=Nonomuraea sp. 10N515B TaxID=3457422 RepID=UPI003FCD3B96